MAKVFKWLIGLLAVAMLVMMLAPAVGLIFGAGFDPS